MNDNTRLVTRLNLTDELAKYHLGTNPDYIKFFSKYPENWREESAAYVAKLDGKQPESEAAAESEKKSEVAPKKASRPKAKKAE